MIYTDFESILVQKDIGNQNPDESYTNKSQEHVACSCDYEFVYVDGKFNKRFESYLGEDSLYNFISSMIRYAVRILWKSILIKTYLKKMSKKDDEDFENSNKCWICYNVYVDDDVKERDLFYITGKYRVSAHRDCNIKVKSNHKILVLFQNLKNYVSYYYAKTRQV